jgi:hypothetical protein
LGLGCNKSIQENNWKYSIRFEGIPNIELQSHTQERDGHMSQGQHLHKPQHAEMLAPPPPVITREQ